MKKFTFASIVVAVMIGCSLMLSGCGWLSNLPKGKLFEYNPDEWETTFEDNFDGTSLDTTKWRVGTMLNEDEVKNGVRRATYYTDEESNLFVKDGKLTIRTNWQTDGKYGEGWYTSWVETGTKPDASATQTEDYKGFSQKGGYFEVKCQAPASEGIWSAFWLMPDEGVAFSKDDIQWTATDGLEIDIMESPYYYLEEGLGACTHVLHCDGYDDRLKTSKSKSYRIPTMYTEMHTYALEWDEEYYKFYIDGHMTWKTNHKYDKKNMGISQIAEYMILSVEVGGHQADDGKLMPGIEKNGTPSWAGNPENNDKTKNYDFIIDSVKVMKRK